MRFDFERLGALRSRTDIPMVLHGGSDVVPEMMHRAITMPGGGVSKVNIATDFERALLASLGRETRMSNAECKAMPVDALAPGLRAVEQTVEEKIVHFLQSAGLCRSVCLMTLPDQTTRWAMIGRIFT